MQHMEGPLTGEMEAKELELYGQEATLRNGTKLTYGQAIAIWNSLLRLYDEKPELFRALVAMAKNNVKPPKAVLDALWNSGHLRKDRTVPTSLASVLEAAYEEHAGPDQIPLSYPILHTDPAERAALQKLHDEAPMRAIRYILGPDGPDKGRAP
jgi:hypothetical protein